MSVGDTVRLSPPFGYFTVSAGDAPIVCISAGIGMTPIKSFTDAYSDRVMKIVHVDKSSEHVPFFNHFMQNYQSKTEFVFSSNGRPTAETVVAKALSGAAANTKYYICGPAGFMCGVAMELRKNGVDGGNVVWEAFAPSLSCPM